MSDFVSEDQIKSNITYGYLFRRMWPYGRKSKPLLFATVVSILVLSGSSRFLVFIIGYAIDEGILHKNSQILAEAALVFLAFEILKSISQWAYLYFFQKFGNRVLYFIREDLMKHIQRLPMDYFNRTPAGRIVTRATNDVSNLGDLFTDGVITVLTEAISLVAILISMLIISWKLTIGTMFLAPIFIFLSFFLSNKVRKILRESKKKLSLLNSFVAENLNGIRIVQLYNRVGRNQRRFQKLSEEYRELNLASIRAYAFMQPVMNLFNAITVTIALIGGSYLVYEEGLAIGALVAFMMHVQDFIPPLREILEKYQQFQNSLTSAERVFQMMDEKTEIYDMSSAPELSEKSGQLEIKSLSFQYAAGLPQVLKNINLKIQSGQSLAIVGRTGSGKSTLVTLLQRFYEPPPGTIILKGSPLEQIPIETLRSRIGVVLQDNFIFRGTVQENISLCDPRLTQEMIERACSRIGYRELLARSGRDLDSHIEEKGANLSVGERQLLAFARILAFEPEILILDEATANVDSQTEAMIQKATQEMIKGRTSLIIAHRLSTIRDCDRIVVLHDGAVSEIGTHEELMTKNGIYHQLVNSHANSIDEGLL